MHGKNVNENTVKKQENIDLQKNYCIKSEGFNTALEDLRQQFFCQR